MLNSKTSFDSVTKIWSGPRKDISYNQTVGSLILKSLNKYSDKFAQICDHSGVRTTYREIHEQTLKIAKKLQGMGLKVNDVVGIVAKNSEYLAPLAFAAFLLGLPLSCLDPSFDEDGIRHIFSATKPKIVFCDGNVFHLVKSALKSIGNGNCPIYTMNGHVSDVKNIKEFLVGNNSVPSLSNVKITGDNVAMIVCSSGTTGLPKGVCLTHNILIQLIIMEDSIDNTLLTFSTLYWISGIYILFMGTLRGGTRIITTEQFSPELFLEIIEKYKVTFVLGPPSQMALAVECPDIKKRNLSSLQTYLVGGSVVPQSVVNKMEPYLTNGKIYAGYGMSEVGSFCSVGLTMNIQGNVGQIVPNIEIKVINDKNEQVGINETGEILIKTPFKWPGYYGNPEATKEIYDSDGWIHSGDLGSFNADGNLIIFERKKEILKYFNFHYFPTEIEQVILELPGVLEVCVCGLPDVVATDLPAAAIVRNFDFPLTEKMVYDHVAQKMVNFKHLRGGVYFVDQIPKTASGKVVRRKLKTLLEQLKLENGKIN